MTFTQQDFERQQNEFEALKEEFARLQSLEEACKKTLGVSNQEVQNFDLNNLSPSEKQMLEDAKNTAKRAGSERASQANINKVATSNAGAGRKGVIRL